MATSIERYNRLIEAIRDRERLDRICRLYAAYILATCGGNISKAARMLDVHRRTLHRWEKERRVPALV